MSTEEKAKAYDEALKLAIEFHKDTDRHLKATIERIFPELRESEDEIIRNRLINLIRELASATVPIMTGGYFIDGQDKRYIAYLEKQKELPFVKDVMLGYPGLYFYDGERMHFRGPAMEEKQKEQKEIPLMNGDADLYFDTWIQHNDTTKRGCFEEGIRYAQRLQKEQKPADLPPGFYFIDLDGKKYYSKEFRFGDMKMKVIDDKKSAEWSEEDETAYNDLMWCIEQVSKSAKDENDMGNIWFAENWVKNRLKSLRPSWKPSEEQMIALYNMIPFVKSVGGPSEAVKPLESLYEDLKKL